MPTIPDQINAGMDALVEKAGRGLVQVHNGRGAGAGTIWHSEGLVLTNAHVAGRGPLQVTLRGGATLPARLLASDTERDLAALAVEGGDLPADLPIVELGESISLRPGQWVLALGHPFGVTGAATAGVVIGAGAPPVDGLPPREDWIAVSLHLRPGYSGGPLVGAEGRLVGINTVMTGPDVGLAVPVHAVKEFLRRTLGTQDKLAA